MLRRRLLVPGALCAAGMAIAAAGCSSGLRAETRQEYGQRYNGVSAEIGGIALRNIYLAPPQGADEIKSGESGYLHAVIVNATTTQDTLTGIATDAGDVSLGVSSAVRTPTGTPAPLLSPVRTPASAAAIGSGTPTATPSRSGALFASATPVPMSPTGSPSGSLHAGPLAVVPQGLLTLGFPNADGPSANAQVRVNRDVRIGTVIRVTFTFAQAGSVAVDVPVDHTYGTTATATPPPAPTETPPPPAPEATISPSPSKPVTVAPTP